MTSEGQQEVRQESLGDVLDARRRAGVTQPLGDANPLDELAMRDHVVGLEAELANARAEAEHWRSAALGLRAQMRSPLVRAATIATRLARSARERAR